MKKTNSLGKLIALGIVLYLSTLFLSRALVIPQLANLFDGCSAEDVFSGETAEAFYAEGLAFECTTTPFITIGIVGALMFVVLLGVLGGNFGLKKKGYFWLVILYILATTLVGVFWRETILLSEDLANSLAQAQEQGIDAGVAANLTWLGEPLDPAVSTSYSYAYTWLNVVAGMFMGMGMYIVSQGKSTISKSLSSETKSVAKKAKAKKPTNTKKKSPTKKKASTKKKAPAKKKTTKK